MDEMENDTKQCPFCGGEIKKVAIKCKHCGKFLNQNSKTISIDITNFLNVIKIIAITLLGIIIATLVCWVLFADYPSVIINSGSMWHGQYLESGILHTLLAILSALILLIIKK